MDFSFLSQRSVFHRELMISMIVIARAVVASGGGQGGQLPDPQSQQTTFKTPKLKSKATC